MKTRNDVITIATVPAFCLGLLAATTAAAADQIAERRTIDTSAEQLWDRVGKFFALADWHPLIESSHHHDNGMQRRVVLKDGPAFTETLLTYDADHYRYSYRVNDPSPLPLSDYRGTIHIDPNGDQSTIVWSATYTPTDDPDDVRQTLNGLFNAGLDALESEAKALSGESSE